MICDKCGDKINAKDTFHCSECGKTFCPKHIYQYVDGNNISITNNSPYYCKECEEKKGI